MTNTDPRLYACYLKDAFERQKGFVTRSDIDIMDAFRTTSIVGAFKRVKMVLVATLTRLHASKVRFSITWALKQVFLPLLYRSAEVSQTCEPKSSCSLHIQIISESNKSL